MSKSLVERYEQVLAQDPASTVFVELAKALIERGDHPHAIDVCKNGLQHHPSSVVGRVLWGKALINLGKPSEAMTQFDLAMGIDRENPHAYNLIGEALLHKGLYRSALPILRKAAALQPNDNRVRQWLEQTKRALAGGPAPVLTDFTTVDGSDEPKTAVMAPIEATAEMRSPRRSNPTPVPRVSTPVPRGPSAPDPTLVTQAVAPPPPSAPNPLLTALMLGDVDEPSTDTQAALPKPKEDTPPGVALGDDPFAQIAPDGGDSLEMLHGLTSTFEALAAQKPEGPPGPGTPASPPTSPAAAKVAKSVNPNIPVLTRVETAGDKAPEPTIIPSQELMAESPTPQKGGLLDDVASMPNEMPASVESRRNGKSNAFYRTATPPPEASHGRRALLLDIPDFEAEPPPAAHDTGHTVMSTQALDAIGKEEERQRRKALDAKLAEKTFLQRHGRKVAITVVLLVVVAGLPLAYLYTRMVNRGKDLATAVGEGKAAINADTREQYLVALDSLNHALTMDSGSVQAWALKGYAHALMFAEHGRKEEDRAHARDALSRSGVGADYPELVLVSQWLLADPYQRPPLKQALLSSAIEKSEVKAVIGHELLLDGKGAEAETKLKEALRLWPSNTRALVDLGEYALSLQDFESAYKHFSLAVQVSSNHPGAVLGLADARLDLGRELGDALREVEKLPTVVTIPPALWVRRELVYGRLLSANGRHADALKVLTEGEQKYKEASFDFAMALGLAYRNAGQMGRAQDAYEEAIKLSPKSEEAKEGLGRVLLARSREKDLLTRLPGDSKLRRLALLRGIAWVRLGEYKKGRQELQSTAVGNKVSTEAAAYLALADAGEDQADKAATTLEKLAAASKKNKAVIQVALARVYMQKGALDKAKGTLTDAAKDPNDYEANTLLGELLLNQLSLPEMAVDPLTTAVSRNGSHAPARRLLTRCLLALGKNAEALAQTEAWLQDNPQSEEAQVGMAVALLHNGEVKKAKTFITKGLDERSEDGPGFRYKAQILFANGDQRGAIAALQRANQLDAKDAETFCEIGHAFARQGVPDAAAPAYDAARREDPKSACGVIGPLHARPLGTKNAVKELQDALKNAHTAWDKALGYATLARVYLAMNQTKEAKKAADEAVENGPFSAPAHYAAGMVASRSKDSQDQARTELQKAVELDPSWAQARLSRGDLLLKDGPQALPAVVAEYEAFLQYSQNQADISRVRKALPALKKKL
ncbi:MAG: tetratricopeptide repeat protein [Myxococcaceae bacterium]|nr:tetratricopeptide repeat protein [Myxococcaceae bacterium]